MIKEHILRFIQNNRSIALVELAIIIPIFLILLVGIVEFSWIYNGHITLTGAAREGARVAAVNGDYENAINNHINKLPRLSVGTPNVSGGESQGDNITVELSGGIALLTGFFPFLDDPFPLFASATMRRQYADID